MKKKPSPMMMAIANVSKIPPKKEPKGNGNSPAGSYYYPPSLYLTDKEYPGVKDFKPGQEVQLMVAAKVTSVDIREDKPGKQSTEVRLSLTSIGEAVGGTK